MSQYKETTLLLNAISKVAKTYNTEVYVVGGYVRDLLLKLENKDLDFVVVGNGIEFAKRVKHDLKGDYIVTYNKFGTAKVEVGGFELEFVGARSERYSPDSRNPVVEGADLNSDLRRRDFTINAMAISLNSEKYEGIIDLFNGAEDLKNGIIRTPLEPDITFADDPLRMMRAIRFATRFNYTIEEKTWDALALHVERLNIISYERITEELKKTLMTNFPSTGLNFLHQTGVFKHICPEISEQTVCVFIEKFKEESFKLLSFAEKLACLILFENLSKTETKNLLKRLKVSNKFLHKIQLLQSFQEKTILLLHSGNMGLKAHFYLYETGENYADLLRFFGIFTGVPSEHCIQILESVDKGRVFSAFELAITGENISHWISEPPSKRIGELKDKLIHAVLSEKVENEPSQLHEYLLKIK